ncbi:MAG: hypothetical protein E6K49_03575 [Gammaproteobacteria bacterium]|nr:MAG: hypothetical protein E6K49_03575 [Gammaproteobacteria bacterium]
MSGQIHLNGIELERLERELYALLEIEQAAQRRWLALPVGYEKSQALAEYSTAVAAASAMRQKREGCLVKLGSKASSSCRRVGSSS